MKKEIVLFTEWFKPCNTEHLNGFLEFENTGSFPKGFLPENILFDENWHKIAISDMAEQWMRQAIVGKVEGIPSLSQIS